MWLIGFVLEGKPRFPPLRRELNGFLLLLRSTLHFSQAWPFPPLSTSENTLVSKELYLWSEKIFAEFITRTQLRLLTHTSCCYWQAAVCLWQNAKWASSKSGDKLECHRKHWGLIVPTAFERTRGTEVLYMYAVTSPIAIIVCCTIREDISHIADVDKLHLNW